MKKTVHLIAVAFGAAIFNLLTATVQAEDYTYTTNNGTITITRYKGPDGDVNIPDTINGLPVTRIGTSAFFSGLLTSVTIPDSVTSIGDEAFAVCTNLNSVTIPDNVTSIGDNVFISCASLTNVVIGNSVTSLG